MKKRRTAIALSTVILLAGIALSVFFQRHQQPMQQNAPSQLNTIQRENQLPGTTEWQLTRPASYDTQTARFPAIEGYAWTTSATAGDTISFSVSTTAPFFTADIYRLGWYQGKGGRLIQSIPDLLGDLDPMPSMDAQTGLMEADWPAAFTLKIEPNWVSGMYIVKLTAATGEQSYIPFVVRSDRASDFAFIHAASTDEAYNNWGGKSLYGINLANFAADSMCWQIRYESATTNGAPDRVLVGYKADALDPLRGKDNSQVTVQFRQAPVNRPEQTLLGSMWAGDFNWGTSYDWVVADASNWVFANTGLKNGDHLPGLVGYEYDNVSRSAPIPAGTSVLSSSHVHDIAQNRDDVSNATVYTARSGARVFNAATIQWSWGQGGIAAAVYTYKRAVNSLNVGCLLAISSERIATTSFASIVCSSSILVMPFAIASGVLLT